MILLELFLVFLKIGAVSFGGGYGMISLIREEILAHDWMGEEEFLNMVAVAESTPGPIAVNMATFIGSEKAGLLGSVLSTFAVVLPAFMIILMIAVILKNVLKYRVVQAALSGIRPTVIGLILATGSILFLSTFWGISAIGDQMVLDFPAMLIFVLICVVSFIGKRFFKKKVSPILLIVLSGVFGIVFYSLF